MLGPWQDVKYFYVLHSVHALWMITKMCHPEIVVTVFDVKYEETSFVLHAIYIALRQIFPSFLLVVEMHELTTVTC